MAAVFLASALVPLAGVSDAAGAASRPRRGARSSSAPASGAVARDRRSRLLVGRLRRLGARHRARSTSLVVVAAIELLDLGEAGVGLLNAAIGIGGLVGARRRARARRRAAARGARSSLGTLVWSLPICAARRLGGARRRGRPARLVGVGNIVLDVAAHAPPAGGAATRCGRACSGSSRVSGSATIGLGAAAVPLLIELVGPPRRARGSGRSSCRVVVARVAWRRLDAPARPPSASSSSCAAFRSWPRCRSRRSSGSSPRLERRSAPARAAIVREREAGDRFYVVAEGALR